MMMELKERAARLRLPSKRIAELGDLDETTVGRALNGQVDPRTSTVQAIERVIAAEERELRDYLVRKDPRGLRARETAQ